MKDTSLRHLFPFFQHPANADLVYFDNAATTQKPQNVLTSIQDYYLFKNANVHRSSFSLANQTTAEFEDARGYVQQFIGAQKKQQIVFTKGATESINLVAKSLSESDFPSGGRILLSATEHHANIVPWQILAKKKNLQIDIIPIDELGVWELEKGLALLTNNTCIVALALVSNALGSIQPVEPFLRKAKAVNAISLVDAAQAIAHLPIDVNNLDCDFLVFSGHKAFAPTGTGVLYGKQSALESLPVFLTGGEMVKNVEFNTATYQASPLKFEAGTPHIEGILALKEALHFIDVNRAQIIQHEAALIKYLLDKIQNLSGVTIYGDPVNRIATLSFTVQGHDSQDIGIVLAEKGIAVRVGHHCAMPLMKALNILGTIRVSLSCYNTFAEIDFFVAQLSSAIQQLGFTGSAKSAAFDKTTDTANRQVDNLVLNIPTHNLVLADSIKSARGWDQVFRQIMLAGKSLKRLAEDKKTADSEVFGCESQVWLLCKTTSPNRLAFEVDASSKIVRGLLAIILEPIQNQTAEFVSAFDYKLYLSDIQLDKHLSETRGNGLAAVIEKIQHYANQNR
ncbi:aminotransferase class V-fold PLP-dependent enzyme [Aliiglaciecola sp. NS0011-25]|uniref:aminotransferase class V-fold PLP-dependent enzyme n=1 Tax=Aliiglaciecola sp. NS0011-25 TaxID=3127654 RepID=UPI003103A948